MTWCSEAHNLFLALDSRLKRVVWRYLGKNSLYWIIIPSWLLAFLGSFGIAFWLSYRRPHPSLHKWLRSKPRLWVVMEWIHKNFCGCAQLEEILVSCDDRWQLYDQEHLITKVPEWYIPWNWDRDSDLGKKYGPADLFMEEEDGEEYWGWTARPIRPKIDPETGSLLMKFYDLEPNDLA